MEPRIGSLSIENFRALRDLELEELGCVTMLTGRNNTGKSSVLEALLLLASGGHPAIIHSILSFREEGAEVNGDDSVALTGEPESPWASLFTGFPAWAEACDPVVIRAAGAKTETVLKLTQGWFPHVVQPDGSRSPIPFDGEDASPSLEIDIDGATRTVSVEGFRRHGRTHSGWIQVLPRVGGERTGVPCVSVSPFAGERTSALGHLWDKVALSDLERDVLDALRIIEPSISAVSMIGGEGSKNGRTAIVRTASLSRPVPLRSFGDGLNRLFGIALALVNAAGGILLIDEFENGMHHTVQADVWRAIFRLAKKLDVQVLATSHSWDAIEAFQEAARETPDEGVLVRLSRLGDDIAPTVFREEELAIATREGIEVR